MLDKSYTPPYTITDESAALIAEIGELLGMVAAAGGGLDMHPRLRRDNRIRTIHASLAIENNSLSLDQVTDIINGKWVLGPPQDIREVQNAYQAYELLLGYDPLSLQDMLAAHKILMTDLTKEAGRLRSGGVGVFAGEQLVHMAPPADIVPQLMEQLFEWLNTAPAHPLVKSCVFHYEFEFIHPFADGNGRMGRMWQTLLLSRWKPIFAWLPVETMIRERQQAYYRVLAQCDSAADSGAFIAFLLRAMRDTLQELAATEQVAVQVTEQVQKLLSALGAEERSLKELMEAVGLRHRPTFRENYLLPALELGLIEMTVPDKPNSSLQRYRRKRGK